MNACRIVKWFSTEDFLNSIIKKKNVVAHFFWSVSQTRRNMNTSYNATERNSKPKWLKVVKFHTHILVRLSTVRALFYIDYTKFTSANFSDIMICVIFMPISRVRRISRCGIRSTKTYFLVGSLVNVLCVYVILYSHVIDTTRMRYDNTVCREIRRRHFKSGLIHETK